MTDRQALEVELGCVNAEWRRLQKDPIRSAIKVRRLQELQERRLEICIQLVETRRVESWIQVERHTPGKQGERANQKQGNERAM